MERCLFKQVFLKRIIKMIKRVLVMGGYGNFGRYIVEELAKEPNIQIIIAGRSLEKAQDLASKVNGIHQPEAIECDIHKNFSEKLQNFKPDIVIHASGPFQEQDYQAAKTCIDFGIDYIDLADDRDFVSGIHTLDSMAKQSNVTIISGASSVPTFTSALIDDYQKHFSELHTLDYAITTAQKTTRGLATIASILSYTGKPFKTLINGKQQKVFGLQGLQIRRYSKLGYRCLGLCNVPDLILFPKRYPTLKTIRFYAGLELTWIHLSLWLVSWFVRIGLIKHLEKKAVFLLKTSFLFDRFGSDNSGFHMTLSGKDHQKNNKTITFELTASNGDGPYIPCIPAILLCKKLVNNLIKDRGAFPCVGMIAKEEYLKALSSLDISWCEV